MNTWSRFGRATLRQGYSLRHARGTRKISADKHALHLPTTAFRASKYDKKDRPSNFGHATAVTDAKVPFKGSAVNMDDDLVQLVRQIHASPTLAVFYVAGGGLQVCRLPLHAFLALETGACYVLSDMS